MACERGLEGSAACALDDACKEHDAEGRGGPAGEAGGGEDGNAGHQETLAAEAEREPVAGGKDDGVSDQVAGENPGGFVVGGRERAGDVGQGDGGDSGVEHLHEGGEHDGGGDEPRVYTLSGLGGLVWRCDCCRGHGSGENPSGGSDCLLCRATKGAKGCLFQLAESGEEWKKEIAACPDLFGAALGGLVEFVFDGY